MLRALAHAFAAVVYGPLLLGGLAVIWSFAALFALVGAARPAYDGALAAGGALARIEADLAASLLGARVQGAGPNLDSHLYLLIRALAGPLLFPLALIGVHGPLWAGLAERLLHPGAGRAPALDPREIAGAAAAVGGVCVVIWAAAGFGYFWPMWPAFGVATFAGLTAVRSKLHFKGLVMAVCLAIWVMTGLGYFWPIWPLLGMLVHEGGERLIGDAVRSRRRVSEVTQSRAEVVDEQEDELRRIERDLHDGAQARLLSMSMSLGLAESRLDEDPDRARELLTEARQQAGLAREELRGLIHRIAPPVLRDRGLKVAISTLTGTFPLPVTVIGDETRVPAAIERAGYFVATEALANAVKHAGAHELRVVVRTTPMDLTVEVSDDGRGGADENGSGLQGLKRRVEAVDGRLTVESTAAGTTVSACLPLSASS